MSKQTETVVASTETDQLQDMPTLSVDRVLGHIFSEIDINPENLARFYESLPHENKPPLSELTIHLSATPLLVNTKEADFVDSGTIYWKGTSNDRFRSTPELPKTSTPTIVLYVGSALLYSLIREDRLDEELSVTVSHELTHYAQGPKGGETSRTCFSWVKDRLTLMGYRAAIGALGLLTDSRWAKTGSASFALSEVLTDNGWPNALKVALGTAALTHVIGKKKRKEVLHDPNLGHEKYLEDEREVDARTHERYNTKIINFKLAPGNINFSLSPINELELQDIINPKNQGTDAEIKTLVARHRELSQKPPNR